MTLDKILESLPNDQVIAENCIIAYSKINSNKYEKIICTISGGYDSDIMLDICVKCDNDHKIVYVYFDTGLEYEATKAHIKELEEKYGIKIKQVKNKKTIPLVCREKGVPFLSKLVSDYIDRLQKHGFQWEDESFEVLSKRYPKCEGALKWWCNAWGENSKFNINRHRYLKEFMIDNPPTIKISKKCCYATKKSQIEKEIRKGKYELNIVGLRKAEGGVRSTAYSSCFKEKIDGCDTYLPLWYYKDGTKEIYRTHYEIKRSLCYEKYGLKRTGCMGCPFGRNVEEELEIIRKYEPKKYKAIMNIFGESYRYEKQYRSYATFKKYYDKQKAALK